ncbi:unnamed protein product [Spirodela intermedia]|uniref:Uncharacterized protein n=1 Tax=Spirodela intermedia TaxID=51605 RepID=A0A7I8JX14_SPIIN|nr:unnamed protein product [Spirodela intermedia]
MGDAFINEINQAVLYLRRQFSFSDNELKCLEDVKSLNEMSLAIRARLSDAEEMEVANDSAKLCLDNLKKIFHAMEDLRDEFFYNVIRLKSQCSDVGMVCQEHKPSSSTIPHGYLVFMRDLVQSIWDLKDRQDKEMMDWDAHAKGLRERYQLKPTTVHRQSISLMGSTSPIGRGDDLEKIKCLLFSELNGHVNIPVIAIVGMGGLGKTTLTQLVYNDPQVKKHFNLRAWVCVSEDFDKVRLTREMLKDLEESCDLTQMDPLQRRLKSLVDGKRLLLVFDDIWEHQNFNAIAWEDLCKPLLSVKDGSRIIVTTRDQNVLDRVIMGASVHKLPRLREDDCFTLFSQHAFEGRATDIDPTLLEIGKKITNKCRGLPLAVKTLGSLLCGQDGVEEWNDILNNSGIWPTDDQSSIMPILRLSYQHLPTKVKICFRYCSVFPKDYKFYKEKLINMWMAHGYITRTKRGKKQLEDIGNEYINELLSRSLFEQSENPDSFQMHDLIHDIARDVSQGEWWSVENGVFYGNQDDGVQHCSIISTKSYPQEHVQRQPQIRCLLFFNSTLKLSYINDLFSIMRRLRVLDMSYNRLPNLPDCISDLKHLRCLSLERSLITELPESVGSLHLLESLNLNNTWIRVLPSTICFLKCLRYLNLSGTSIEYLPDCIANLSSLRRLICDDDVVFPSEIRNLTDLYTFSDSGKGRHVVVKAFTDLVNLDEARKASSYSKEHLKVLSFVWKDNQSPMADHIHGEVLKILGRPPNLRQLYMQGFGGSSLPSWLTSPSYLPKLNRIDLIRCNKLTSLPHLEFFPFLRHLYINSAKRLQDIGPQFSSGMTRLPNRAELQPMSRPMNIFLRAANVHESSFHLYTLIIVDCPNISSFTADEFNYLRVLKIISCPQLHLPYLAALRSLKHLSIIGSLQDIPSHFSYKGFLELESLELEDLPNWRSWAGPEVGECPNLRKLSIVGCNALENFSICWLHKLQPNDICVKNCKRLNIPMNGTVKLLDMEK